MVRAGIIPPDSMKGHEMATYVDANGTVIELPPLTVDMMERFAEAAQFEGSITGKCEKMLSILIDIFEDDYITERLGSAFLDEVDAVELFNLYTGVDDAYEQAMHADKDRAQKKRVEEARQIMNDTRALMEAAAGVSAQTGKARIIRPSDN